VWLWAVVLERRTAGGWELADLVEEGATYDEASRRLGVTPSAISQRAHAAGIVEGRRARELVVDMAERLLEPRPGGTT
jgi:transposase-like protein